MKKLTILLIFLVPIKSFSCGCVTSTLLEHYQRDPFIATAKIVKIQPDTQNSDYHDIEIEIINLYKGVPIRSLKVETVLNTSCSFYTPAGSTWLIFASRDRNGFLCFGACSGSLQMDRQFDTILYPGLDKKYAASIALKLEALAYLKQYEKLTTNQYHLIYRDSVNCLSNLKGFNETNRIAIYKVNVSKEMKVTSIKTLKAFDNKDLSEQLINCLRQSLPIRAEDKTLTKLPKKASLLLIYYYYPAEDKYQSFVSNIDV